MASQRPEEICFGIQFGKPLSVVEAGRGSTAAEGSPPPWSYCAAVAFALTLAAGAAPFAARKHGVRNRMASQRLENICFGIQFGKSLRVAEAGRGPMAAEGPPLSRLYRAALAFVLAFAAGYAAGPTVALAGPDALWRIVHDGCAPHFEAGRGPEPCEAVDWNGGVAEGVAILKDLVGVAQMLAIPTRRISGIEDPQMLETGAPPAFADAWKARTLVEARLGGRALPRQAVALAINSQYARSQEQLHVHVDCVRIDVDKALRGYAPTLDDQWRAMTVALNGRTYFARRLLAADLVRAEPLLRLVADGVPDARAHMGAMSLAAVGAEFGGEPGFVLLADVFSLEGGGHAEDVQDHDCAIARTAP